MINVKRAEKLVEFVQPYLTETQRMFLIKDLTWKNKVTRKQQTVPYAIFFVDGTEYENASVYTVDRVAVDRLFTKHKVNEIHLTDLIHPNIQRHADIDYPGWTHLVCGEYRLFMSKKNCCIPVKYRDIQQLGVETSKQLIKSQLMFPNSSDAYQIANSVSNYTEDISLPHTRRTTKEAACKYIIQEYPDLCRTTKVWYKPKSVSTYYDDATVFGDISEIYPIITLEDIEQYRQQIAPQEVDAAVIGLGSGGTTILDQLVRSNYFTSYMLNDFDKVEQKNLNNQWYRTKDIGFNKTRASKAILNSINPELEIFTETKQAQRVCQKYSCRYLFMAVDNLNTRCSILDKIEHKQLKVDYLIDQRYKDLDCSIYFINCNDEAQMEYYEKHLRADVHNFVTNNETENTCIKFNYIDIYRYVGSIIFAGIRKLEQENKKQFTHIEATTQDLPHSITIRK